MRFKTVRDVAEWRLCAGCGACAYACRDGKVSLKDVFDDGIRPFVADDDCRDCTDCLQVCPGIGLSRPSPGGANDTFEKWGPVLSVWEGYAVDEEVRFRGSSGGAVTALALYCMEELKFGGVLHAGAGDTPLSNKTHYSVTRTELLSRAGSRYSPASPCDSLGLIESAKTKSLFIGKPCDVAALQKAAGMRPALKEKVGASIAIFCAGTPSTKGTAELIKSLGAEATDAREIRYRGRGWPGVFSARVKGAPLEVSYREAWSFLQRYRPYRCHLCPDGTGEFADISCGDPWHREKEGGAGRSIVVARTWWGQEIVEGAIRAGYLKLPRSDGEALEAAQRNLLEKKSALWGRLLAFRLFFLPSPAFSGFLLRRLWRTLGTKEKLRAVLGTARRIARRGYLRKKSFISA